MGWKWSTRILSECLNPDLYRGSDQYQSQFPPTLMLLFPSSLMLLWQCSWSSVPQPWRARVHKLRKRLLYSPSQFAQSSTRARQTYKFPDLLNSEWWRSRLTWRWKRIIPELDGIRDRNSGFVRPIIRSASYFSEDFGPFSETRWWFISLCNFYIRWNQMIWIFPFDN